MNQNKKGKKMQPRKLVATGLATAIVSLLLVSSILGAVQLGQYPTFLGAATATGFAPQSYIVVGASAATSDVVGAIDLGADLQQLSYVTKTAPGVGVAQVTGGVSLDTADTKIYLTDVTNKAKTILTATDLPDFLTSGSVEDVNAVKYEYSQYLNIGGKTIQYAQPDVSSGIKDPAYLVKLGTSPGASAYLVQGWVSFTKQLNASNAVGKEIVLFGKSFTISSETDSTQLVLFGTTGKETITAGETKTITVGTTTYTVQAVGIVDSSHAVLSVNGIQKEVTEGNTYDFGGTSVYVSEVFYYKVPVETGSVVVSIGADRYVFKNATAIYKGASGNEVEVKGTYVILSTNPQALSDLKVSFDAYTTSPQVDYIKAGTVWTDPVFGIKVAYNGPATTDTQDITIIPGATTYYTIAFTDKYGKSGTVSWVYDADPATSSGETLADSAGNAIHVAENENAAVNEYVFVSAGNFPHMLKVTSLETGVATQKVTYKDVFSGTEYKATNSSATTGTLVIDGQQYTVTFGSSVVAIKDSDNTKTYVYPALETKYGAKIAFTKPVNVSNNTAVIFPTGEKTITCTGTDQDATPTGSQVKYNMTGIGSVCTVELANTSYPAVLLVEEQTKDPAVKDAAILYVTDDSTTDKRLELASPIFTHASGNAYTSVGTASTTVSNSVTEWGTKVVYDTTAAGTATITYPDTQVYHLVAVGSNPAFTTTTAGVTYNEAAPLTQSIAKLDTELIDTTTGALTDTAAFSNYNIVIVGGPCVNALAWKLIKDGKLDANYTCGGAAWTSGTAYVIAVDDAFATGKIALLVAGTTRAETRLATDVLSQGKIPSTYTGSSAKITGTITSPTITQP